MKRIFTKTVSISLIVILTILIAVLIPNFIFSLRRARDQVRRDDLGSLEHQINIYFSDFGEFPPSSTDGKIVNCQRPDGKKPYVDEYGKWIFDRVSCEWGKDPFTNLATGGVYMTALPRDPDWQKGVNYYYISDGVRYQLFASMEGNDEAEVDSKIISEGVSCGNRICNVGRSYESDFPKTLETCAIEANNLKKLYH